MSTVIDVVSPVNSVLTGAACSPVDMVHGEPTYRHVYVISDAFRAMVDKMCYLAVFGTKSVFETKVPATTRAQFHNYITDLHSAAGAREKFAQAWKAYVRANPPFVDEKRNTAMDQDMITIFGLDDNDDDQPAAAGGGSAVGEHAEGEAATPPA